MRLLLVTPSSFTLQHQFVGQLGFLHSNAVKAYVATQPDQRGQEIASTVGAVLYPFKLRRDLVPLRDITALFHLLRIVLTIHPHLIQSCTKKGGLLSGIVGRLTGTPVVYAVFGLMAENMSKSKERLFCIVEKLICILVDRVVVISRSNMQYFQSRGICPTEKLVLFGSGSAAGVDTANFSKMDTVDSQVSAVRRSVGILPHRQILGFVGRLVIEKGIQELFAAWQVLRDRFSDVDLLIVSPPEVDPRLNKIVAHLQDDPRVHFIGFMADPRPAYAAMDCLVLPSYSEGFPNVLLEAGAMEIPVVATRVSGCVDAVIHKETGLLIEPRNSYALVDAIEWILHHPEVTREWGRNARERCMRDFKPDTIWQAYLHLYRSLVTDCDDTLPEGTEADNPSSPHVIT